MTSGRNRILQTFETTTLQPFPQVWIESGAKGLGCLEPRAAAQLGVLASQRLKRKQWTGNTGSMVLGLSVLGLDQKLLIRALWGPIQSISRDVRLSVCVCVCMYVCPLL